MSDTSGGQVQTPPEGEVQGQPEVEEVIETPPEGGDSGYGPDAILKELDEFSQQKIKDKLLEMESNATKRIESVNESYKPWKPFVDAGYTPDQISLAIQIISDINNDPLAFQKKLEEQLRKDGLLATPENIQKAAEEIVSGDEGEGDSPAVIALQKKLEAIERRDAERQQSDQYNSQMAAVQQQVDADISSVKSSHPEWTKPDMDNVFRIADVKNRALAESGRSDIFTVVQAAEEWEKERQQILSTPRPGQNAPKLPPVNGNAPVDTETRKASEIPTKEWDKMMADLIESKQG